MRFPIRFGKKDDLLKTWLQKVTEYNGNVSYLCMNAIAYYEKTGKYVCIGLLKNVERIPEPKVTTIYVVDNSEMDNIYQNIIKKTDRGQLQTYIKQILIRSIVVNDEKEYIPSKYDDLQELCVKRSYLPVEFQNESNKKRELSESQTNTTFSVSTMKGNEVSSNVVSLKSEKAAGKSRNGNMERFMSEDDLEFFK